MPDLKPIYTRAEERQLGKLKRSGARLAFANGDTDDNLDAINAIRETGMARARQQAADARAAEDKVRRDAARELAAANAEKKTLRRKKQAAEIKARNQVKIERAATKARARAQRKGWW